jgi:hypothetical protein
MSRNGDRRTHKRALNRVNLVAAAAKLSGETIESLCRAAGMEYEALINHLATNIRRIYYSRNTWTDSIREHFLVPRELFDVARGLMRLHGRRKGDLRLDTTVIPLEEVAEAVSEGRRVTLIRPRHKPPMNRMAPTRAAALR